MKTASARDNKELTGSGVSRGAAVGRAFIVKKAEPDCSAFKYTDEESERSRLESAVRIISDEICKSESDILKCQLSLLKDPLMLPRTYGLIASGLSAASAVDSVCAELCAVFKGLDDENMSRRAEDIEDIRERLLGVLLNVKGSYTASVLSGSIPVAKVFTPSMMCSVKNAPAVVSEGGGIMSHGAIIAREREIPAVFSVRDACEIIKNGDYLIVDGTRGRVIVNPSAEVIAEYEAERRFSKMSEPNTDVNSPAAFRGKTIKVYGNISSAAEARKVMQYGDGIGLFRTEMLFISSAKEPSEEEQLSEYSAAADIMSGRETVIRTLDVGGDKKIGYLNTEKSRPRGIRFCLKNAELFKRQLRAVLRAAAYGNIKIMLPFVTSLSEVREAKAIIGECAEELEGEGLAYRVPPLGIMIETPSAALISDLLAREADFFSIGTNDLTCSVMASDRYGADDGVYRTLPPAVLRAVKMTVDNAHGERITVNVCGEAAADTELLPILLESGIDGVSVAPALIPSVKRFIRKL